MIIVFSTTKENNGTAEFRDKIPSYDASSFIGVSNYFQFIWKVIELKDKLTGIFALSDIHYVYAVTILRYLKCKVPVLLGYYHPDQWKVSLDSNHSKTLSKVMNKIIERINLQSIVFSSNAGFIGCNLFLKSKDFPNIIPGPVFQELNYSYHPLRNDVFSIATIGRLVPFKTCTILAMIEVVESLLDDGKSISYKIYGDGPGYSQILDRISNSRHKNSFDISPPVFDLEYSQAVCSCHAFFGMGGAVIRAALLGVPSIIAIQREQGTLCYGLICDHDQKKYPVFGDDEPLLKKVPIKNVILNLIDKAHEELIQIGNDCQSSCYNFTPESTIDNLKKSCRNAQVNILNISIYDLFKIRFERLFSNIQGVKTLDA